MVGRMTVRVPATQRHHLSTDRVTKKGGGSVLAGDSKSYTWSLDLWDVKKLGGGGGWGGDISGPLNASFSKNYHPSSD